MKCATRFVLGCLENRQNLPTLAGKDTHELRQAASSVSQLSRDDPPRGLNPVPLPDITTRDSRIAR